MQAVIHGAVGHLSPAERQQYSAHLEQGGLSRQSEALLTWSDASVLDRDAFRQRFVGGIGNDKAVDHLRRAARGRIEGDNTSAAAECGG